MTYIEFFDENAAENLCTSLVNPPDRVVLIGDNMKKLKAHAARYRVLLQGRGHQVDFVCRAVNKNSIQDIVDLLTTFICQDEDCVVDLTGGEDLFLVAAGILSERFQDRNIQMHRFNIRNGNIVDCDLDGNTIEEYEHLKMTVRENILAYGGGVVDDAQNPMGTHDWQMTPDFTWDIWSIWEVCREDVRKWNSLCGFFDYLVAHGTDPEEPLRTVLPLLEVATGLQHTGGRLGPYSGMIGDLYDRGILTEFYVDEDQLVLSFKDEQIKRILTKAGQALEMVIYGAALEARDPDGKAVYNDAMTGVFIDWDGIYHDSEQEFDTTNEIDVLLMHGVVPVFVSCKNGMVQAEELYKLNAVAERFGGKYARKVLVATALDSASTFDEYFRQRAKDMNIRIVEGIQELSEPELQKTVRSFWSN